MPVSPSSDVSAARIRDLEQALADSERKREALKRRIQSLTQPYETPDDIRLEDIFNIEEIQRLQDLFADACKVASIITRVDGTPITQPSNFCRLCATIIRGNDKGLARCSESDAAIRKLSADSPYIQKCQCTGLWNAGANVSVGGRHIANWLIGQVRDDTQSQRDALDLAESRSSDVALVIADVVMPGLNGRELVDRIRARCPTIKALFMFGYTSDVIAHRGVLEDGVQFIQKPFTLEELAVHVRAAMAAP